MQIEINVVNRHMREKSKEFHERERERERVSECVLMYICSSKHSHSFFHHRPVEYCAMREKGKGIEEYGGV